MIAAVSATTAMANDHAVPPGSDGFTKYGAVEGWNVFIDNERKTCLIERVDEADNVVQMGVTKNRKFGYVGVFTKADLGLKKGKKSKIYLDLDGNLYWSNATDMKGNITEGYQGAYILANNPDFISDVEKKYVMTVFPKTEAVFTVDLKGTYKAIEAARKCTNEQG